MTRRPQDALDRSLDALLGRTRRRVALYGLAALAGWGGGALVVAAWLVGGAEPPAVPVAWGLSLSTGALLVLLAVRRLLLPLGEVADRTALVRRIEARRTHANLLVAAEESLRRPERWSEDTAVGRELVRRVRVAAAGHLDRLGPGDVVAIAAPRAQLAAAGVALGLLVLVGALAPADLGRGLPRLAAPWTCRTVPPTAGLLALAGPSWVVAGSDVTVEALDVAGGPGLAVCEVRRGDGRWQPLAAVLARDAADAPGRLWRTTLAAVTEDFHWRFRRGTIVSPERAVIVRDHPLLTQLGAEVVPPAYTGGEVRRFERLPAWIEVPAGSRVLLRGEAGSPLAHAALVAGADTTRMAIEGTTLTGQLDVAADVAFRILIEDAWGLANAAPLAYEIAAAPDQAPAVALVRPGDDGLLPLDGTLALVLDAADDYGLGRTRLLARAAGDRDWSSLVLSTDRAGSWAERRLGDGRLRVRTAPLEGHEPPLRGRWALEIEAGPLRLAPGQALELMAEVDDNREPGPVGVGRSSAIRLMAPAPSDVLARQDEGEQRSEAELAEARRRSRELDRDLDRLTRELMKNPVPDWGRQQEMEEALRRQEALQQELARIGDELRRRLEDLASSQLTSEEQLRRADEVEALLAPPQEGALEDLMRQGAQEGGERDPQQLADALREAARQQQDLARRLDAAQSMMDRMAREQDLESMTAMLEQMMQRQQDLADRSREQAGADQAKENARRQQDLARELDELKDRLAESVEQMRERAEQGQEKPGDEQAREALEQALEQLEQKQQQNRMNDAAEQLAQLDPQMAAQLQQQAMRDLGSLYHVLLKTQIAMQSAMQMNQVSSLRGLAADLLAVSARQETVAEDVPDRLRDVRLRDLTRRQHRLQQATIAVRDGLAQLMEESPQRILKILEQLDALIERMGEGVRALEDGRGPVAQRDARDALAQANRLVIHLLTEAQMNMPSQSGGGSSSSSDPSQQLQDLAREQARLNGATEELRRMLADRGLSQEARSRMQRLGQEQAAQAGRVRDLAEQERVRADGGRVLGDLQAMGQDLESIAEDLGGGLVDEQTLVRQDRILSRMLDARNAARRRDYSTRRESRTADELYGPAGPTAGRDAEADARRLRLRYQPLEKAPLEYRDLVRRYFAGLDSLGRLDRTNPGEGSLP
ncbi:MAG TPA: DUF4175 family protein [Candidatus Krumholzibacteria bacterium]|nr:DUF4175 family protein [Candidatus Krumholzibacteria bacterium]